jgi:hypothetical protein
MINFFILNGTNKRTCTASETTKAAEILRLMFPLNKGYVIEDNKVVFAHNMTVDEAEAIAGIKKIASMEVLPIAPKVTASKPKKAAKKKPVAKKTVLKSKVAVKNNKKAVAKKTVVKSKVKPKTKAKAKKPAKVKAKAKGKKR